ncbi:MAG: hypothetical protein O3A53_13330 [Acidobacteria bacterium]|nr:hypothetical protein [Acidobacteriota bacterium]
MVPFGSRPRVIVRNLKTRQSIHGNAGLDYFDPSQCEVVIQYDGAGAGGRDGEQVAPQSEPIVRNQNAPVDELLLALEEAERLRDFVALTWFRDHFLKAKHGIWVDDSIRGRTLVDALEEKLVLTSQVANPRNPLHPVTAIRLNRSHPRFAKSYDRPAAKKRFNPARISGAPLSRTVIEGRR